MSANGKLMVRSLAYSVRDDRLRELFGRFGEMSECKVIMERDQPDRSRGFAFVTFKNSADADRALRALDNHAVDGRSIRVQFSDKSHGPGGSGGSSGGGGGGGGVGGSGGHGSDAGRSGRDRRGDDRESRDDRSSRDGRGQRDDRGGRGGRDERSSRDRSPGRGRYDDRRPTDRYEDRSRRDDRASRGSSSRDNAPVRRPGAGSQEARDPNDDNTRIYITNLPADTTEEELAQYFGGLGMIARKKQKRGYPDQWPYKITLYTDEQGKFKGDAVLAYEDPNAAQSAPEFFNQTEFKGVKIGVEPAKSK
mmetsp:Transcript_22301/g.39954  ORF Transcript_22301/g.39954 Transcript_22301/m.39954 type:complete len:307 (-) Transcript_22301:517-1437(-)